MILKPWNVRWSHNEMGVETSRARLQENGRSQQETGKQGIHLLRRQRENGSEKRTVSMTIKVRQAEGRGPGLVSTAHLTTNHWNVVLAELIQKVLMRTL